MAFLLSIEGSVMRLFLSLFVAVAVFGNSVAMAQSDRPISEKYFPFVYFEESPSILILAGEIDVGTSLNFSRFVLDYGSPDILLLDSPGGLVHLALDVALKIDQLGIDTAIPEDFGCYSACAFMFLAGKNRYADGELGVHQISSENADFYDGQLTLADMIDVLNKFNTPPELLVPMLSTPPEQMYVLSNAEINSFGFIGERTKTTNQERVTPTRSALEIEALSVTEYINELWSNRSNKKALEVIDLYSTEVLYYGNVWSKSNVAADKAAFATRWPSRQYKLIPERSHVTCNAQDICSVMGFVQWSASNPKTGKTANGASLFDLVMRYSNGRFYIIEENSSVVKRH